MLKTTIGLAVLLGAALFGSQAAAVEEPAFRSELHEGAFEIRDYPGLVVAEVTVSGGQNEAANKGFRLLAGYIFGGNQTRKSISMTAPVAQAPAAAPASEKIAMTAPVSQTRQANEWVVRFTMPSAYSLATLPQPNDPRVHLRAIAPARFAVLRFSGVAGEANVKAKTAELDTLARSHRLSPIGPATLAQYDPPWTPGFMRRNEVMLPVAP